MSTEKKTKRGRGMSTLVMGFQRRDFLKLSGAAGVAAALPFSRWVAKARAKGLIDGLSDPAAQPKFMEPVPNALDPGFIYDTSKGKIKVAVGPTVQETGLVDAAGNRLSTPLWGYGSDKFYTWPGRTFEVQSGEPLEVKWENRLTNLPYLITNLEGESVVDTSLHWAYSLHGYEDFSIDENGTPLVMHLHGGHTAYQFDGNPEFFFSPGWAIRGPQWVDKKYVYLNDQPAGNLWYHDHSLGLTRLNVYTGLAGFYFVRDDVDTGAQDNPLGLPAFPYELAYAIQDRMFKDNGELFYPAFDGDPFWEDFIEDVEGATPPVEGGPSALAEFFGDHIVVNGKIWPKTDVEPRNYRMHLLNGCDSRFMILRFRAVPIGDTDFTNAGAPLLFYVIGSDQGLGSEPVEVDTLVFEPGSRYDIVFDFSRDLTGMRVIMENIGGDAPFGGDYGDALGEDDFFKDHQTDRVMAFDVTVPLSNVADDFPESFVGSYQKNDAPVDRPRKVALFEGKDEYGRLQPLLGTAEPATDYLGEPINWPSTPVYSSVGLTGQMEGSIAWHSPTTENPKLGDTEEWEVWNATGDAHPVHLHLVHFDVLERREIKWDSHTTEDDRVIPNDDFAAPKGDGTYLVAQPTVQHNSVAGDPSTYGMGFRIANPISGPLVPPMDEYVENAPKDMVSALPSQITKLKATFDKPGRYVWHCHILSHEDHEMMRVLHVGPGA
jgi:FtsP/CotA-like multicopper oxidase with cupredoxin domain